MNAEKQRVIEAIINTFETGVPAGDYSAVTILRDGAGISYGRSQATDRADNLDTIVYRYIDRKGPLGEALRPFLDELEADGTARVDPAHPPEWCRRLMALLAEAGKDAVMRKAQDDVFHERYWVPAKGHAESMGLMLPLSWALVYDTCIQSGPDAVSRMRKLFPEQPPVRGGKEEAWARAYVAARQAWLASHPTAAVRRSTYRTREFRRLIDSGNWQLETPFTVLKAQVV